MTSKLHRYAFAAARVAIPTVVTLVLIMKLMAPHQSSATIERIYTIPFYTSYDITCPWGPYVNCGPNLPPGNHNGTDYTLGRNTSDGEAVSAAFGGTAWQHNDFTSQGPGKGCGYYIVIAHGNGHRTRYCHLKDRTVGNGAVVVRGEIIGHEGSSGTDGSHLHFDTRHGGSNDPSDCCSGTSVDPYAGPYSPGTYLWEDQPPGGHPPGHADYSPASVSWSSSRVDVFVRGRNNHLYQRTRTGSWGNWFAPPAGACLKSAPAASSWSTSRIDVFYRGCDNLLYWAKWTGTWATDYGFPGSCLFGAPAATTSGANRIDVFYRGCNNLLYWVYTINGGSTWSGHYQVPYGTCLRSGPGAVSWGSGRLDVVYRGCDDAIWHHWFTNNAWQPNETFGGCTMMAPSITSWGSNKLDVFHRGCGPAGAGEGVYVKSYNNGWSGWNSLGGCLASGPGADAWAPDQLDVPYRDCNYPAGSHYAYWNGGNWGHAYFANWP